MNKIRIGINGFGRIGRLFLRSLKDHPLLEVVAINSGSNPESHAFLLKHDSNYGAYLGTVSAGEKSILVDNKEIAIYKIVEPAQIPWGEKQVDIVIECSGLFTDRETASKHLHDGVKKVIISAPGKDVDGTFVMGVNEKQYDASKHHVIANASCTTNCLTPIVYLLHKEYGIKYAHMSTTHSYTSDQNLLDNSHPHDLRRARAAGDNIIPTTTGATLATTEVIPALKGKISGISLRVPTSTVSILYLVADLEKETSKVAMNDMFRRAATGDMQDYLAVSDEPLVSSDFKGDTHSSIIDALSTDVVGKHLASIVAWYDNEWGYTQRLVDLANLVGHLLN
ncbi:MAG: type I glyceraldehyde-3-phosphate dehydrogenase [Candidatus Abawacabacteria bacterium]|nr:type I glyceraldehyde-3-phosphate dehydrogenase [Candidatus Abawacabacteria bacterium]